MLDAATMSHDELLEYMRTYNSIESWQRKDRLRFRNIPATVHSQELIDAAVNGGYVDTLREIPKKFRTEELCLRMIRDNRTRGNFSACPKNMLSHDLYMYGVSHSPGMFADAFCRSRKGREENGYTVEDIDLCLEVLAPMEFAKRIHEGLTNPPDLNSEQEWRQFAITRAALIQNFIPHDMLYEALQLYRANKLGIEMGKTEVVLCEMDYKGEYERFALTKEEFNEVYKGFANMETPNDMGSSYTLRPLVHLWYRTAVLGGDVWDKFFTDLVDGLPDEDIEEGRSAYIREDYMKALRGLVPAPAKTTN